MQYPQNLVKMAKWGNRFGFYIFENLNFVTRVNLQEASFQISFFFFFSLTIVYLTLKFGFRGEKGSEATVLNFKFFKI